MSTERSAEEIREAVREMYAAAARKVVERTRSSCCSSARSCCSEPAPNSTAARLYTPAELQEAPETAASFGCGNPLLLAQLQPGEVVLDLGSGPGLDVILSARRVGPMGKAYGLDMTDEMLDLARSNAREAGVSNAEFLKGHIEAIPLPDASVDVIISNCVINLSADKDAVLAEAWRVLRPGGRLAVADIVVLGKPLSAEMRHQLALWSECVSGALTDAEYRRKLSRAGFDGVEIEIIKVHSARRLSESVCDCVPALDAGSQIASASVRARKP